MMVTKREKTWPILQTIIINFFLILTCNHALQAAPALDRTTLLYKHIAGYQGWFLCPNDGSSKIWRHWFRDRIENGATFDLWPDLSEFDADELCPTPFKNSSGQPLSLFSSQNPKTVDRHFKWMADYNIDGVALGRFIAGLKDDLGRSQRDRVLDNVRAASKAHGRVFFIWYDITGSDPGKWADEILADWGHLVQDKHVTNDSNYLFHRGKPLLAIWGLGVKDRPGLPAEAKILIEKLRSQGVAGVQVSVLGGLDHDWRKQKDWYDVWNELDVISPWTVGNAPTIEAVDEERNNQFVPDIAWTRAHNVDYLPVIYPGFSWDNLQKTDHLNAIPRECGKFYQAQADAALQAGARMLYSAMFDEVDEGTAIFKTLATSKEAPVGLPTVTLDADGCSLTSDFYLRLAGKITSKLHAAGRDGEKIESSIGPSSSK